MMQELLGGGNNVNTIGGVYELSKLISSPSPSPSSSTGTATTAATPSTTPQNLRCPRCDSANTKFCYYNNYNLTQPRHFCKTCRRYWTKGGALRNVPIGGGCRKNRSNVTSAVGKSTSAGKMKSVSQEMSKLGLLGFDQTEFPHNPILYPSSNHTSHLLSILRGNQNQNQNPNPNHLSSLGSSILSSGSFMRSGMGLDPLDPIPSVGLPNNSFYRNEGVLLGEVENNGVHELYQRLRSSTSCYPDHGPIILGNISPSSAANSGILDSAPVGGGFWNPNPAWSINLSTTHGAFP